MTEVQGGRRTFFHHRGANAHWDGSDLDFASSPAKIFHLGYLLLLDALDASDPRFGTRAASLLARAQQCGLTTSIDVVSEDSDRFGDVVTPALHYTDYCIINEIEAGKTHGIAIRSPDGQLNRDALQAAAAGLLQRGVRKLVVIHFPEGGFACSATGEQLWQPSLDLPGASIAGCAGAGDAYCAGVLLGLHEGWDLRRCLTTGNCVAAASLSHPTCTGGVGSLASAMDLQTRYGRAAAPTPW
jgi:sugar/nucleoside kinase (ribokinase family)